mmetsp:Transcript_15305/g.31186  ORF Transcript_15305/g.31186 Transcript_15305/m.31186 type:complete len:226 (-) Transcript_15305:345-1022(-)
MLEIPLQLVHRNLDQVRRDNRLLPPGLQRHDARSEAHDDGGKCLVSRSVDNVLVVPDDHISYKFNHGLEGTAEGGHLNRSKGVVCLSGLLREARKALVISPDHGLEQRKVYELVDTELLQLEIRHLSGREGLARVDSDVDVGLAAFHSGPARLVRALAFVLGGPRVNTALKASRPLERLNHPREVERRLLVVLRAHHKRIVKLLKHVAPRQLEEAGGEGGSLDTH